MTVAELLARMSSVELAEWEISDRLNQEDAEASAGVKPEPSAEDLDVMQRFYKTQHNAKFDHG